MTTDTVAAAQLRAQKIVDEMPLRVPTRGEMVSVIASAIADECQRCADVAARVSAGRFRQHVKAKDAKQKTEARDFQSMAMSASEVEGLIRGEI